MRESIRSNSPLRLDLKIFILTSLTNREGVYSIIHLISTNVNRIKEQSRIFIKINKNFARLILPLYLTKRRKKSKISRGVQSFLHLPPCRVAFFHIFTRISALFVSRWKFYRFMIKELCHDGCRYKQDQGFKKNA